MDATKSKLMDAVSKLHIEGSDFLSIFSADEIDTEDEIFDDELIERILNRDGMSVMYGDSNCGKTFLALEMACCIALGKAFLGQPTEQGAVLYLATEGYGSVIKRLKAYKKHHGVAHLPVFVVKTPVNFFDQNAHTELIIKHGRQIESETGLKIKMVIGDTMARIAAGANENSGQDMAIVIKHAEFIRNELQTHFMWIHHCGKDAARGMRGWSGIRAAIDTEIEIAETESGVRSVEITKQRDGDGKGDRYGFTLKPVRIGENTRGEERTTCVVELDFAPEKKKASGKKTKWETLTMEIMLKRNSSINKTELVELLKQDGCPQTTAYGTLKRLIDKWELIEPMTGILQHKNLNPQ